MKRLLTGRKPIRFLRLRNIKDASIAFKATDSEGREVRLSTIRFKGGHLWIYSSAPFTSIFIMSWESCYIRVASALPKTWVDNLDHEGDVEPVSGTPPAGCTILNRPTHFRSVLNKAVRDQHNKSVPTVIDSSVWPQSYPCALSINWEDAERDENYVAMAGEGETQTLVFTFIYPTIVVDEFGTVILGWPRPIEKLGK